MRNALIIGGARSGKYMAKLLNDDNYHVVLTDINEISYKNEFEALGIEIVDNGHPETLFDITYDLVIMSPGIRYTTPFIQKVLSKGYRIHNEIEIALRYAKDVNVLAITGTNGKTTTVTMLYEMMKRQFDNVYIGGNIGIPVSQIIYEHPEIKHLVLELSSFQLDAIYDLKPSVANITNLKEDHLDYYSKVEDYYNTKQTIYANQDRNDFLLVNNDDELVLKYLKANNANVITYGLDNLADVKVTNNQVVYKDVVLFDLDDLKLVGKHNLYNAIVASLMAYLAKVSILNIKAALVNFKGVEHRIEYVLEHNQVKYYNDSKATNIESLIVALKAFNQPVILIAGGYDKQISFDELSNYQDHVKQAILFGQTKDKLKEVFTDSIIVEDLESAVKEASLIAKQHDIVLFSPACASFDQFKDYAERGELFKTYVENLNK